MSATQTRNRAYFALRDSTKLGEQQNRIMRAIDASNNRYGIHDHSLREIAALTGLEINAVSGRVNELKKAGLLVEAAQRRCKVTGRTVTPLIVPVSFEAVA